MAVLINPANSVQAHRKPIIGIVSCAKELAGYSIQAVNQFYLKAVRDFGGIPLILSPELKSDQRQSELERLFEICNGLLFPGSHSNVAPHRYQATHTEAKTDETRDELSLSLLRMAVEHDIPCLGICRGFQEMNVALGGSLHPAVHEAGFSDHREDPTPDFSTKYAPTHPVQVQPQGVFSHWLEQANWPDQQRFFVNSLHNQGVDQLAPSLQIEAHAPDGLIEAFSLPKHRYFVGVQWHPEWQATENAFSQLLFRHFITAASPV